MNLKVTKNIQQLVAQRRAKKIETVRNEVITVNLKDARAKLAESTGAKQVDSPTTPTPVAADISSVAGLESAGSPIPPTEPQDVAPVMDTTIEKSEAPPSPWADFTPPTAVDITDVPVAADVSSGTDLESVDAPIPPMEPDAPTVPVKKPTRSRSRSKSKAKK